MNQLYSDIKHYLDWATSRLSALNFVASKIGSHLGVKDGELMMSYKSTGIEVWHSSFLWK